MYISSSEPEETNISQGTYVLVAEKDRSISRMRCLIPSRQVRYRLSNFWKARHRHSAMTCILIWARRRDKHVGKHERLLETQRKTGEYETALFYSKQALEIIELQIHEWRAGAGAARWCICQFKRRSWHTHVIVKCFFWQQKEKQANFI